MFNSTIEDHALNYVLEVSKTMMYFSENMFGVLFADGLKVKISFNEKRKYSWGGKKFFIREKKYFPYISLSLGNIKTKRNHIFLEYKTFENDKNIGNFFGTSWESGLNALIAHELAHAIQYSISDENLLKDLGGFSEGHRALWKNIYTVLRINFVNEDKILLDEKEYKKNFENYTKQFGYYLVK